VAISGKNKNQFEYVNIEWIVLHHRSDTETSFDELIYSDALKIVAESHRRGSPLAKDLFVLNYKAIESNIIKELFRVNN
jgi:hypothetical protein